MKKSALIAVKLAVSIGIIAYLVSAAQSDDAFTRLASQPKDWSRLGIAWACLFAAAVLMFTRWFFLVRALELPFRFRDALRLGFLGYLLNFVSLWSVGGDLFKAVFLAREQPGRRTAAVATVMADRVIGLYGLFLLAGSTIIVSGLWGTSITEIRVIGQVTLACVVGGAIGACVVLSPGFTEGSIGKFLGGLPRVGLVLGQLIHALRMYRRRLPVLALALGLSLLVHTLSTIGVFLIARGIPGEAPGLAAHFVAVPLAMVVGALPLPFSGLGAFEGAIEFLYRHLPSAAPVAVGQGLIVAIGYRACTIAIAIAGIAFYITGRREVAATIAAEADFESASALDDDVPSDEAVVTAAT